MVNFHQNRNRVRFLFLKDHVPWSLGKERSWVGIGLGPSSEVDRGKEALMKQSKAQKERKSADISANTLIRALPSLHRLAEKEGGCRSWLPEQLCRSHASED